MHFFAKLKHHCWFNVLNLNNHDQFIQRLYLSSFERFMMLNSELNKAIYKDKTISQIYSKIMIQHHIPPFC